ncbi:MAG TPA: VIT family protein [Microbacteriaceae bacterium]|nr:VIT family protein [Microbacteriaceae bacterium]
MAFEPHVNKTAKLNWLRAGVLGANDGIVSVSALVVGVAAATDDSAILAVSGIAALLAGAISMALGEYVSVSTQRDTERALIALERRELAENPDGELQELADIYQAKGISPETALQVAKELTAHDALAAHLHAELNIDQDDLVSPWHAAFASAISFTVGAVLPLLAALLLPAGWRIPAIFGSVLIALTFTGWLSAGLGGAPKTRAILRVTIGGALGLLVTWGIGSLFNVHV